MLYFINPKERSRRMAKRKKRRSPAQKAATRKMIAARKREAAAKRKGRRSVKRKTRRAASKRRKPTGTMKSVRRHGKRVSRAAWKRSGYTRNKPRRNTMARRRKRRGTSRKRSYRRNPAAFSVRGVMKSFQQGVIDAAGVVGGKAATRLLANVLPLPKGGGAIMGFAVQGIAALIVGTAARQFLGKETARMMIAGGFAAPIETIAKGVPVIGPALGDDYLLGEYYMGELPMGEYDDPSVGDLPMGEYVGEYVEVE